MIPDSRLLIVDGLAVAYRAFHAIRGLSTSDGRPVNALFGFVKMLRRLDVVWQPTHWGVVFDGGLPAERMTLQPEYKSQRAPMPEDLRSQLPMMNRYLELMQVPGLRVEGEEADDVMAALVRQAEGVFSEILMATGDKDMYQLVNEHTRVVPVSGTDAQAWGPREVEAKTGVKPEQIVDWLALTGDHADNIPGVPGIGPKTAARLLREYGNLTALLEQVETLPEGRIRDGLTQSRGQILENAVMVRLRDQVGPEPDWDAWRRQPSDSLALALFFEDVEFKKMAAECRQPCLF